jgi:hypothetical protein
MTDDTNKILDLGSNHIAKWYGFHPDRELNPQFSNLAEFRDVDEFCLEIAHLTPVGEPCWSAIHLDGDLQRRVLKPSQIWQRISAEGEPLSVSPSIACQRCGDHGFILDGKWSKA